jgi:hypothetical protein
VAQGLIPFALGHHGLALVPVGEVVIADAHHEVGVGKTGRESGVGEVVAMMR